MSNRAPLFLALALGAPLLLAAASPPALAAPPTRPLSKKEKAAADKAAADKAAADKAAADAAAAAAAAAKEAADKAAAEKAAADKEAADKAAAEKEAADKAAAEKAAEDAKYDPYEDPNQTYRFIGLRFRDAIAPKFMVNWFVNGGRTVNVPMVGPEFITRHKHFEVGIALMYADYSMDPFIFQAKGDTGTNAWEFAQSSLKLGYAMFDLLYEIPLPIDEKKGDKTGRFALLIGAGIGIAGIFGTLYQGQAYPNVSNPDPGNPSQWNACTGPSDPKGFGFCNNRNAHFWPNYAPPNPGAGAYEQPSWANGGSKPMIFPWLALPAISFRYKPIKQFQTKLDLGFSTSGFYLGLSASYGLPSSSDASPSSSSSPSSTPASPSTPSGEGSAK